MAGSMLTAAPPEPQAGPAHGAGSVYERVLGAKVPAMHPQVAALHSGTSDVRAEGWMHVARGRGLLCRIATAAARLPRPGTLVPVRLAITRDNDEEWWVRQFGTSAAMVSRQAAGPSGALLERFGLLTFVFELETDGDQLHFRQRACEVRLAGFVAAIPGNWAPQVAAVAGPAPNGGVVVSVRIDSRWTGPLLRYEGTVAVQESPA